MARGAKSRTVITSESIPFAREQVARRLLAWYGKEGRDLPWRHTRDPYRIWLSEIMLQQTTVAAVIPYFERFLQRFPSLESLANAPLDDVINLWAGLGYYSRARNLHKAAQKIKEEFAGNFPDNVEGLMALPGVGRSTAGAILSIAFDKRAPILDGNVRRVLVRLFAWDEDPRSSKAEKQLWQWAELLTPESFVHDYTQAIMDLGATICTPRSPCCEQCPLNMICQSYKKGLAEDLPIKRQKIVMPVRHQVVAVIKTVDGLLLRQRPAEGFLGGMWEFPTADITELMTAEDTALRLLTDLHLSCAATYAGQVKHTYSHFKIELEVYSTEAEMPAAIAEQQSLLHCCPLEDVLQMALHGAHKKVFTLLNLA